MKLQDVAATEMASNRSRIAPKALPGSRDDVPIDHERDGLVAAIKAGTTYAVVVVKLPVTGELLAAMTAFSDFVRGLRLPDSFAGFAVIGPPTADASSESGNSALVCRILFRAIGSFAATSIKEISAQAHSTAIEFYDDFVEVQAEFVARIDEFCGTALCIAAAGTRGMIPLWMPMDFIPRRSTCKKIPTAVHSDLP